MKSIQIGGKGTIRRKLKRTGNFFKERKSKESIEYELKIKKINTMISNISDDNYGKFKKYLDDELDDIGNGFEKHNFTKMYMSEYNMCIEDRFNYTYNMFVENGDKPLKFKTDAYLKFKKIFQLEHLSILIKSIYDIEMAIEKETYLDI